MDHVSPLAQITPLGARCVAFWTYWNSLPKHHYVPHLSDYFDHVPPLLQPYVVMMDLQSADKMTMRLMGTAMTEYLGEMTGSSAESLYSGETRKIAIAKAWTALNHPCGYLASRTLRSANGQLFMSNGIVLPIRTESPDSLTVVSFAELPPVSTGVAREDQIEAVQGFAQHTWLDIGAGTPAL
ncbi:MAG: hypothetical protein RIF37_07575 [Rhodospirillaceae bacterium]